MLKFTNPSANIIQPHPYRNIPTEPRFEGGKAPFQGTVGQPFPHVPPHASASPVTPQIVPPNPPPIVPALPPPGMPGPIATAPTPLPTAVQAAPNFRQDGFPGIWSAWWRGNHSAQQPPGMTAQQGVRTPTNPMAVGGRGQPMRTIMPVAPVPGYASQ